ncbi:MAG TPA: DUF202 domain-containing protein [Acidimicrobiales bacterium]|nr:DUF202 domain-containing protein [Acidimicrobiales bacterium]
MSLQPERTDLAWRRTGLATIGLALAGLRLLADGSPAHVVAGAAAAVAAAGFAVLARWRSQVLLASEIPPPLPRSAVAGVAAAVVLMDIAGVVLVTAGWPGS